MIGPNLRLGAMAKVGYRMMFHDKLKLLGTLAGVVFAVVLSNQQAGTFFGLLHKNTMFIENAGADVWVTPAGTEQLQGGHTISIAALHEARVTNGVAEAMPLLYGGGSVQLPRGGSEPVTIAGAPYPYELGGPWNVVAGSRDALRRPDTMVFEDSQRDKYGSMNLGDARELSGRKIEAGAFTWGLLPFGPAYAFADYDLARELLHVPSDQTHFVLARLVPGADVAAVVAELRRRIPEAKIMTKDEFADDVRRYVVLRTAIGVSIGSSALFGLVVGFVIVALSMFSSVVDNLREFGTLKAIGARTRDLAKLLVVQSVIFALFGSLVGIGLVNAMAQGIRSPNLALILPPQLFFGTTIVMVVLCVVASTLALVRIHRVEPAMVFR